MTAPTGPGLPGTRSTRVPAAQGHTPVPWDHLPPIGEGLHGVMSAKVNANGNFYVAQCNREEDAVFIVTAVNSHAALVAALRACVSALEAVNADLDADLGSIDHEPDSTLDAARAALLAADGEGK